MRPVIFLLACCSVLCLSACGVVAKTTPTAGPTVPAPTVTPSATPTLTPTPTLSPTPVGLISAGSCKDMRQIYQVGDGALNMLQYSPDGRWLAAATSGGVTLYDAVSLKQVWSARTSANLLQIAFSPQGETISGVDTSVRLYQWQVNDGTQLLAKIPGDINELPMSFALSPDGSNLYMPAYDDSIHIYQMSDASLAGKIEQFLYMGETIIKLAVSPDLKRMASISINGDIRLWSLTDKKMRGVLEFERSPTPYDLMFAPDGKLWVNFANRDDQKTTRVLDMPSQTWGQTIKEDVIAVTSDKFLLSISEQGLDLRGPGYNQVSQTLPEHANMQGKIASSPDGAFLAIGTNQGIHIWQRTNASLAGTIPGQYNNYSSLAVSADGQKIAAGNLLGVEILNRLDGSNLHSLPVEEKSGISTLVYAPVGELLAGSADQAVYVWDGETGNLLWSEDMNDPLNDLAFSADGSMLAGVYNQPTGQFGETIAGIISIWDAKSGTVLQQLEGADQIILPGYTSLAFSADGVYMLAGQGAGEIEIWRVEDWNRIRTLTPGTFLSWDPQLAFAPDGETFAAGGKDRQIQIWKMPEGVSVRKITSEKGSIETLAYSPDGNIIAANVLNDIELWDAANGKYLCKLSGSGDVPMTILFTADQRAIISLGKDGAVRIWGLP